MCGMCNIFTRGPRAYNYVYYSPLLVFITILTKLSVFCDKTQLASQYWISPGCSLSVSLSWPLSLGLSLSVSVSVSVCLSVSLGVLSLYFLLSVCLSVCLCLCLCLSVCLSPLVERHRHIQQTVSF